MEHREGNPAAGLGCRRKQQRTQYATDVPAADGEGAQNPDRTSFLYLAPVTRSERTDLLQEACRKARASAEELAAITGNRLGQTRFVKNDNSELSYAVATLEFDDDSRFLSNDGYWNRPRRGGTACFHHRWL